MLGFECHFVISSKSKLQFLSDVLKVGKVGKCQDQLDFSFRFANEHEIQDIQEVRAQIIELQRTLALEISTQKKLDMLVWKQEMSYHTTHNVQSNLTFLEEKMDAAIAKHDAQMDVVFRNQDTMMMQMDKLIKLVGSS